MFSQWPRKKSIICRSGPQHSNLANIERPSAHYLTNFIWTNQLGNKVDDSLSFGFGEFFCLFKPTDRIYIYATKREEGDVSSILEKLDLNRRKYTVRPFGFVSMTMSTFSMENMMRTNNLLLGLRAWALKLSNFLSLFSIVAFWIPFLSDQILFLYNLLTNWFDNNDVSRTKQ